MRQGGEAIDLARFRSALRTMSHRGPDNESVRQLEDMVIFGHNRLAIIDLNEKSNQPFIDESGEFAVVYNGEIFNYVEIREELVQLGDSFSTESDTEVLLKSFIRWGDKCVSKFNGMWAFAIYNFKTGALFCSRDRFGIKPFYYALHKGSFVFSSEIKAILQYCDGMRTPNLNLIANFCRTSVSSQTEETWFMGIRRLMPATNIRIDRDGIAMNRYWRYPTRTGGDEFEVATEKYRDLFFDAVGICTRSDVGIGLTLSSGLDSSSIAAVLKRFFPGEVTSFTATFNDRITSEYKSFDGSDESDSVRRFASDIGLKSEFITVQSSDVVEAYRKIVWHLESGQAYSSMLAVYKLFDGIAKTGTKVVLEGQGADELLAGYYSGYAPAYAMQLLRGLKIRQAASLFIQYVRTFGAMTFFQVLFRNMNHGWLNKLYFSLNGVDSLFVGGLRSYTPIPDSVYDDQEGGFDNRFNEVLARSHSGVLLNLLHYGDAISMGFSIETRFPFLDHRLVEYAFTLPADYKFSAEFGKRLHRHAMVGLLPDYVVNSPLKLGFNSPLDVLFRDDGPGSISSVLLSPTLENRGLFDCGRLRQSIYEVRDGKLRHLTYLFRIFLVELWFQEFIDP